MSDIIAKDTESLEVSEDGAVISLFEISFPDTNNILYFHPENTSESIIFDGKTYEAFPIGLEGLEISSEGAQTRPTLVIPNVESLLNSNSTFRTALTDLGTAKFVLDDLIGARITRRKTLFKYVYVGDESEYDSQNAPAAHELPKAVYIVDRISAKSDIAVELELASPFDLSGTRIPSRNVIGKYCPWLYKGYSPSTSDVASACTWRNTEQIQGENENIYTLFFNSFDEPVVSLSAANALNSPVYSGALSYNKGDFVVFNGGLYGAKSDVPASIYITNETYWQIYRIFTTWSPTTTYTVVPEDTRKNSYAYNQGRLWRVINPNNKGIEPGTDYSVWVEGDVCGKLISSCKKRFQATIHENSGTGLSAVPEPGQFNTSVVLPFGGFPGTRKFR